MKTCLRKTHCPLELIVALENVWVSFPSRKVAPSTKPFIQAKSRNRLGNNLVRVVAFGKRRATAFRDDRPQIGTFAAL